MITGLCAYCLKQPAVNQDHVVPKSLVKKHSQDMAASYSWVHEPAPPLPPPASEDGSYLDDDWLDALRRRPFTAKEAAQFLVRDFPTAVGLMWCPSVGVTEATSELGESVVRVRFATGGWSGAEELIGIVLEHFWMRHFYVLWRAGGLYIFEVGKEWL